jgi:hypothetical protein
MKHIYGTPNFTWWFGVVEDRKDPEKLGRCKVRIIGYHTEDTGILPSSDLPWALPMTPITSASTSGIGSTPVGPVEGTWVVGWFLDGDEKQQPIMMGTLTGRPDKNPVADKIDNNKKINEGQILTTSSGNPVYSGSGIPITTGSSNVLDDYGNPLYENSTEYSQEAAVTNHPNNPRNTPSGALNDPSLSKPEGFQDPNKIYPKVDYDGKPDTNKLATEDKSHKYFTVKTKNRKKSIKKATGGSWDEPTSAYNAKYPFNQVFETEAGHVIEYDSTPNAERIHMYHNKGTYIEIDINGTMVRKVVGDNYEVCDRNGYVYVKGAYNLTVGGATKILVQNDADIEVDGDTTVVSHGSTLVQAATTVQVVAKDIKLSGKSSVEVTSDGPVNIQGSSITLNAKDGSFAAKASKDAAIQSGSASIASIKGGLELLLDAATVKTKMGAISITSSKLKVYDPPEEKTVNASDAATPNLTRPDAPADIFLGDGLEKESVSLANNRLENGSINDTVLTKTSEEEDNSYSSNVSPTPVDTSEFSNYADFPDSLKLSKYYTLGDVSTRASASKTAVRAQNGLSTQQIVGNLKHLAVNVLDPIKEQYPDVIITSGFRAGASGSDHNVGQAVDLQFTGRSYSDYYEVAKWIKDNTPFKQVLLEYATRPTGTIAWIHVAAAPNGGKSAMPIGTLANHSVASPGKRNTLVNLL